jgi:VanZ like protein/concanavalin A-like lectin/glucanase superfamily protein
LILSTYSSSSAAVNRFRSNFILALSAIYSLMAGLYPFEFADGTPRARGAFPWGFVAALMVPIEALRLRDFLQNIVYFLPWGVLVFVFVGSSRSRALTKVVLAALLGGILSLAIELSQVFFLRSPSIFDVLANILGAGLGALLCTASPIDFRRVVVRSLALAERSRLLLPAGLILGMVPLVISVIKSPWTDFHNWNQGFTFQIANEASLNRPWLGKIHLAAIYDRALAQEEIVQHYRAGVSRAGRESRSTAGLIALYTFSEGRGVSVRDVSGYGSPLNLTLSPSSHFRWHGEGDGLEVIRPAILRSDGPAKKLYGALRESGELSVEIWITPANVRQKGPARIVSFSRDPVSRNFTVGQERADIDFRLRTPLTGPNGTIVNLRTRDGFLTHEQFHLVATYKDGVEKLYVDGREHPDRVDLTKAEVMVAFGTKKSLLSQLAYSLFYFFPASFFCSRVWRARSDNYLITVLLAGAIAVTFLGLAEYVQAYAFARPFDLHLLGYGAVSGIVGALCGASFVKKAPALEALDSLNS